MGVDHVGTGAGPHRIWSRGTLMQIVPPQILSYRYKKERPVAFKICQNPFSAPDPSRGDGGQVPQNLE